MKYYYIFLSTLFFAITILSAFLGQSSAIYFILFSVSTYLMMSICFFQKEFIGVLILSLFLFMGFWFKTAVHFIFQTILNEPVGNFNFNLDSWREVLLVAAFGMLGLTLGVYLCRKNVKKYSAFTTKHNELVEDIPRFYINYRIYIYICSFFLSAFISYLNLKWGIHQVGMSPKTILLWPFNTVISFLINIGLMFYISIFLYWDTKLKKNILTGFLLFCFTAFFTSISALSRGMFVIQMFPYFVSLVLLNRINVRKNIYTGLIFLSLFLISIKLTTILRFQYYPNVEQSTTERQKKLIRLEVLNGGIDSTKLLIKNGDLKQSDHLENLLNEKNNILNNLKSMQQPALVENNIDSVSSVSKSNLSIIANMVPTEKNMKPIISSAKGNVLNDIYGLILNRFIGIEGLMAIQSYDKKGLSTLFKALIEKRTLNSPSIYQEVAKSTYRYTDMSVWQFATLPGIIAFLYFSGSLTIVFLGMFFVGILLIAIEIFITQISYKNVFLVSLLMSVLANSLAQFGVTPRQDLPYYFLILVFLVFCWLIIKFFKKMQL